MNMKKILALAAVAVATVAGASTNYVKQTVRYHNVVTAVSEMSRDSEFADPAAFRAALVRLDESVSTGKVVVSYRGLSRCCPLTARANLERGGQFSAKACEAVLAVCGYDAENKPVELQPGEDGYANFALQTACTGIPPSGFVRSSILNSAIVPVRRTIRAEGGSFVGKEGAKLVKAKLDALAAELNAPRFGKAGEILKKLDLEVEWEFIQSRILSDAEVGKLKTRLMDGEIPFDGTLQNKLCIALGVEAYNAFVKEYNGTDRPRS